MVIKTQNYSWGPGALIQNLGAIILLTTVLAIAGSAQTSGDLAVNTTDTKSQQAAAKTGPTPAAPLLTQYREIKIGTPADEVRDKLGKPKIGDADGFYYEFSDDEFAQIRLDSKGNVRLISMTYSATSKNAPSYADILGQDSQLTPSADGSIYKLVRYPEAGFWVAYARTGGDNATVTVTMQKL